MNQSIDDVTDRCVFICVTYRCVPWTWWPGCSCPAPASGWSPAPTGPLRRRVWSPRRTWDKITVKEEETVCLFRSLSVNGPITQTRKGKNVILKWSASLWQQRRSYSASVDDSKSSDLIKSVKSKIITALSLVLKRRWRLHRKEPDYPKTTI